MPPITISYIKEKWAHAGFQKYFKSTGWMLSSRVLSMVISLLTTIFIARNLGPTNFGQLSYAISFIGLFSFLASLGIDNFLYRDLIKYPDKKKEFLGSALIIKLSAGIFTAILAIICAVFFVADDVSKILIFILAGTFIFTPFQIINFEFQARVKSKYPSIISLIVTVILNVLKIVVMVIGEGVIYLSLILLLESILYAIFYWFAYEREIGGRLTEWKFDKKIATTLLSDSWPLIFSSGFTLIYSRIDQVFIKHLIDAKAVGVYDAAVRIAEVWYFIPSIIIASFFPAIVNAKIVSEEIYNLRLKKLTLGLLIPSLFVAITVSIFAPLIMSIVYGAAFIDGVTVLKIYVWSVIAVTFINLSSNYLITENYKKILFFTYFVSMASNVILNLLWIPKYGIIGSAYATLISYSLGPISLIFFKQTRERIFAIYNGKQ